MERFVSKKVKELRPYVPGKSVEELERELGIKNAIKLASNENPLGPSKKAIKAMERMLNRVHLYPDGQGYDLKKALAEKSGMRHEEIILGNGSNEIIEMAVRTFLSPGEEVIIGEPAFSFYNKAVTVSRGECVIVPLRNNRYDLSEVYRNINDKTRLIFIDSPNNPTGTIVKEGELKDFLSLLSEDILLVMDEAYHEYVTNSEYPDTRRYINDGKNVLVLRTFSKIYGLAGLRIGYGIAREGLIELMERVHQPFNINALAQIGALAALSDKEHVKRSIEINSEGRKYLYRELNRLGLKYIPTEANFILFDAGRNGKKVYESLLKEGVIVRYFGGSRLRVTIGLPKENRRFIKALENVLHQEV